MRGGFESSIEKLKGRSFVRNRKASTWIDINQTGFLPSLCGLSSSRSWLRIFYVERKPQPKPMCMHIGTDKTFTITPPIVGEEIEALPKPLEPKEDAEDGEVHIYR